MRSMWAAWVAALLALASAAPAAAVDFVGYFRDGYGVNSKGGGQACFKTPGQDYKLRLGNECDNYGEWGLQQSVYKDDNGVEFSVGVMFNYDQSVGTNNGTSVPFGIQQNFVKATFPQLGGATFWAGKQYYERENIDMIDFFYLNTSDTGVGVENVDTGFGKLSFSVFGAQGSASQMFIRPDVRLQGIPVWAGGTLEVDLNGVFVSQNTDVTPKNTDQADTSVWVTGEWHQDGILGGWNTLAVQWANGAAANMGGGVPGFGVAGFGIPLHKKNQQLRALDQLLLQPTNQFQALIGGVYQLKTLGGVSNGGSSDTKVTSYGVFTRPVYYVSDYFKLQGDLGFTSTKVEHQDAMNLVKATFAPTLTPAVGKAGGFFVRPEIRLFVTYGSWNDAASTAVDAEENSLAPGGGIFGTDKSGVSFGTSVEVWF